MVNGIFKEKDLLFMVLTEGMGILEMKMEIIMG